MSRSTSCSTMISPLFFFADLHDQDRDVASPQHRATESEVDFAFPPDGDALNVNSILLAGDNLKSAKYRMRGEEVPQGHELDLLLLNFPVSLDLKSEQEFTRGLDYCLVQALTIILGSHSLGTARIDGLAFLRVRSYGVDKSLAPGQPFDIKFCVLGPFEELLGLDNLVHTWAFSLKYLDFPAFVHGQEHKSVSQNDTAHVHIFLQRVRDFERAHGLRLRHRLRKGGFGRE